VRPRRNADEITLGSTAGRLIVWLADCGGLVECPSGRAGADARRAIGTNSATLSQAVGELTRRGLLDRDANARRTFRLELTATGRDLARTLCEQPDLTDLPVHPDTMGHRFEALSERLGLRAASGSVYTLHSLRHYRATHLYNRSKDWVQVARYLGHTSPAITMDLYANNVVHTTQALLADAAVDLDVED
jgi:integrase